MTVDTLVSAVEALRTGRETSTGLVEQALARADGRSELNALAHLDAERALGTAAERDREEASGRVRGPLHGVPVTIKDLFVVDGMPTLAGTRAALPALGTAEATAATRLRDAGAVILAKANLHEVAYGVTGENPWTGDVRNPLDPARQSGGSSSGSAVAVALGVGLASLGTDTGGSIRIPASHCGIVGFKPTFGRVPLDGALPLSITCDHAGPLARTVADAALMTAVLAGETPHRVEPRVPVRFGVPLSFLQGRLGRLVRHAFEGWLDLVRRSGVDVVDIELPGSTGALDVFRAIQSPEASRVHAVALAANADGFSPVVRAQLVAGASVAPDAEAAARETRAGLVEAFDVAVGRVDAVVLPAVPVPAPLRGTDEVLLESGPADLRPSFLHLTVPFSLTGLPVLSLPFAAVDGLPVGLQVVGRRGSDDDLLAVGAWLESGAA